MTQDEIERLTRKIDGVFEAVQVSKAGPIIDKAGNAHHLGATLFIELIRIESCNQKEPWQE